VRLPLLILHIRAGSVGLVTGTVARAVRKGGNVHRASGNISTVAKLTLATSACYLAILKSHRATSSAALAPSTQSARHGLPDAAENAHGLLTGVRFLSVLPAQVRLSP
jgi:hypothetical protein